MKNKNQLMTVLAAVTLGFIAVVAVIAMMTIIL